MRQRTYIAGTSAALVLFFSIIAASPLCSAAEPVRQPVPDVAAVSKSRQLIRSAYEAEYQAAMRSKDPSSLMFELDGSVETTKDPVRQYALLSETESLARQYNDLTKALAIINKRARLFEEDGLKLQAEMLQGLAGPKVSGDAVLLDRLMHTANQAAVAERFEIATDLAKAALSIAKAIDRSQRVARQAPEDTSGPQLIKAAQELQSRINDRKKAFAAYREAEAILKNQPDDPQANAVVGTYLCVIANWWSKGLPHLVKSQDSWIGTLAKEEVALRKATPPDPAKMFLLAEKWWDAAGAKEGVPGGKDAIRLHAALLYSEVLPHLKDPLEKRVAETRGKPFEDRVVSQPPLAGDRFKPGRVVARPPLVNSVGMKLILISAGTFQMGSNEGEPGEKPIHDVQITKPFHLGVYEVTNAQWKAVMGGEPPSHWKNDDRPVEMVNWDWANDFCEQLSGLPVERKAGRVYRLPTEAEWEYACRAGTATRFSFGDDAGALSDYGWFNGNSANQTHPVGSKKANPWGLYDMYGNVCEWCSDWNGGYVSSVLTDPRGPLTGSERVDRGGGWDHAAATSAARHRMHPHYRGYNLGFRVAMDSAEATPIAAEVFLTDLQEHNVKVHRNMFGKHGRWHDGVAIKVRSQVWPKALFLHPDSNDRSEVTYEVPEGMRRFEAQCGINDGCDAGTPLTFKVLDDAGAVMWKSESLQKNGSSRPCEVQIGTTRKLTLVVECPGGCGCAHAVWLDPRFIR